MVAGQRPAVARRRRKCEDSLRLLAGFELPAFTQSAYMHSNACIHMAKLSIPMLFSPAAGRGAKKIRDPWHSFAPSASCWLLSAAGSKHQQHVRQRAARRPSSRSEPTFCARRAPSQRSSAKRVVSCTRPRAGKTTSSTRNRARILKTTRRNVRLSRSRTHSSTRDSFDGSRRVCRTSMHRRVTTFWPSPRISGNACAYDFDGLPSSLSDPSTSTTSRRSSAGFSLARHYGFSLERQS